MSFADEGQVEDNTPSAEMQTFVTETNCGYQADTMIMLFVVDSYETAMQSVNCDEWKNAMDDELKSLANNNTRELRRPKGN
jgi:hypothetical protein